MLFESFLAALLISFRILLPGVLWLDEEDAGKSLASQIRFTAKVLSVGLCFNLIPGLWLAPFSLWTLGLDWLGWGILLILGGIFRRNLHPAVWRGMGRAIGLTAGFLILTTWILLLAPPRSEWLAGGWDPGIYQNNAIAIANANGIQGKTGTVYSELSEEGVSLFSQTEGAYREVFPGVPIDEDSRKIPLYFFHLTPLLGAWMYRFAGLEGLVRLPLFLGLWTLPVVWRFFDLLGFKKGSILGVAFWVSFPLWLYQLAIPTAEVFYLFLLTTLLVALSKQTKATWSRCGWVAILTCLATINHFNFPLIGGFLLCGFAWETQSHKNQALSRTLPAALTGMWVGVLWDVWQASVTLNRLQEKDHAVTIVVGGLLILTTVSLGLVWISLPVQIRDFFNRILNVLFMAASVTLGFVGGITLLSSFSDRTLSMVPTALSGLLRLGLFSGAGPLLAAGLGLYFLGKEKEEHPSALRAIVTGLLVVFILFLVHPGISPIYPWALRRYITVALPLFSMLSVVAVVGLFNKRKLWKAPVLSVVTVVLILGGLDALPVLRSASSVGEYRGFSKWYSQITEELEPDDILIADDPRWGTPLFLGKGFDVINGKHIWEATDPEVRALAYSELRRLSATTQRRIVWLTSTELTLDVYPDALPVQHTLLEGMDFSYPTVIHSGGADHFAVQMKHNSFGLYVVDMEDLSPILP